MKYEEIEGGVFEVTNHITERLIELRERLRSPRHAYKPGDISFDRCPLCRVPLNVAARRWNPQAGTITNSATGRRMAIFGSAGLEAVPDDLESKLGEAIRDAVVDAQRRLVRKAPAREDLGLSREAMRKMLALRGAGNLVSLDADADRLEATIETSCLVPLMAELMQGAFELAFGHDATSCGWEASRDGDLLISVHAG